MFLRNYGDLSAVQKLQQQQEDLVPDRVHRYYLRIAHPSSLWRRRRTRPARPRGYRVKPRRRLRPTEEFPEEEAPGRQDAPVRVDKTTLHAEGDVTEGLAVDEEVEVV